MIHCPNCGTSNRKGSRFCNECGEPLPSTGIRCPMCDTINPVGNVYCQKCNARLVPMSSASEDEESEKQTRPIKGFSLPTIPLDETEEERAVEETEQEESPPEDWLDELRGSTEQEPEEADEDQPAQQDGEEPLEPADIPDWLRELGPISEEASRPTSAEAYPAEEATAREDTTPAEPHVEQADTAEQPSPSRAAEVSGSKADVTPPSEEEPPPEPAEIPDWLRELGTVRDETPPQGDEPLMEPDSLGEEAEEERPQAEEPDQEETPEWLQDILPSEPDAAVTGEPSPREPRIADEEPAAIEIPDWLKEAQEGVPPRSPEEPAADKEPPAPAEPAETEAAASTEAHHESVEMPSWLEEAETELQEAPSEGSIPPFTEAPSEGIETPDWLTELMTPSPDEDDEGSPFPEELDVTDEEWAADLERARIPDWLQELRPSQEEGKETIRGPMETEGLLKGLRGLIPAAQTIGVPATFEGPSTSGTSEATLARAELLQSLLGQPATQPTTEPTREVRERGTDAGDLAERWLAAGILIFAVLAVLLAPLMTGQSIHLTQPVTASGAADLHRVVDELEAGDHVLVAFDYGPPEADELSAAARPVLEHALERGARVSIVSTRPDGPLIAEAMMARIADSKDQYTFIGYRPGTATAISQLLAATDRTPALLLVLTSRPAPLRLWIEQASARYGDQLPLVAVGSAALEPIASPYLDANAGQLRGAVHGFKGAAAYEALRGTAGGATQRLDALAAGHVAIVVLMIVGALIHALGGGKEKRR